MTPPAVDMASARRVLIIKLSALGDIIHALPVSAALGEAFPHLELTWVVDEGFLPLISGNPYLANILLLPKVRGRQLRSPAALRRYFRGLREVREKQFDLTLDLQGLSRSALLAAVSGARLRLGYHWLREGAALFERAVPRRPESIHIVDQYLDVARFLGADTSQVKFPFHIPEEEEAAVSRMLEAQGLAADADFISVNPASAIAVKQWSAENYAELIDWIQKSLNLPVVLVTADKAVAARVETAAKTTFVNLAGGTNLKQLAAVLRRNRVHICGDTGSAHLAAALESSVVCLMGPTDVERVGPYGQSRNVIRHREFCAAACTVRRCVYGMPRCLAAIGVEEVSARVENALLHKDAGDAKDRTEL